MNLSHVYRLLSRQCLLGALWIGGSVCLLVQGQNLIGEFADISEPSNRVFKFQIEDFDLNSYTAAVENLLGIYERTQEMSFKPGEKGKVGLKVYSNSGPGLSTPANLVEAVVQSLVKRGFQRSDIFIIGLKGRMLRESGFCPRLAVVQCTSTRCSLDHWIRAGTTMSSGSTIARSPPNQHSTGSIWKRKMLSGPRMEKKMPEKAFCRCR